MSFRRQFFEDLVTDGLRFDELLKQYPIIKDNEFVALHLLLRQLNLLPLGQPH
jgi:hypothetical protein